MTSNQIFHSPAPSSRPSLAVRRGLPISTTSTLRPSGSYLVTGCVDEVPEVKSRTDNDLTTPLSSHPIGPISPIEPQTPIIVNLLSNVVDEGNSENEDMDFGVRPVPESNSNTLPPPPSTDNIIKMRVAGKTLPFPPHTPRPISTSSGSSGSPPSSLGGSGGQNVYVRRALVGPVPIIVPSGTRSSSAVVLPSNTAHNPEHSSHVAPHNFSSQSHNQPMMEIIDSRMPVPQTDAFSDGRGSLPPSPPLPPHLAIGKSTGGSASSSFSLRRHRHFQHQQNGSMGSSRYFSYSKQSKSVGEDSSAIEHSQDVSGLVIEGSQILSAPMLMPGAPKHSLSASFEGPDQPIHIYNLLRSQPNAPKSHLTVGHPPDSLNLTPSGLLLHTAASTNSTYATTSIKTSHSVAGAPEMSNLFHTSNTHTTTATTTDSNSRGAAKSFDSSKVPSAIHPVLFKGDDEDLSSPKVDVSASGDNVVGDTHEEILLKGQTQKSPIYAGAPSSEFPSLRAVGSIDAYPEGVVDPNCVSTSTSVTELSHSQRQKANNSYLPTGNSQSKVTTTVQWVAGPSNKRVKRGASSSLSSRSISPLLYPTKEWATASSNNHGVMVRGAMPRSGDSTLVILNAAADMDGGGISLSGSIIDIADGNRVIQSFPNNVNMASSDQSSPTPQSGACPLSPDGPPSRQDLGTINSPIIAQEAHGTHSSVVKHPYLSKSMVSSASNANSPWSNTVGVNQLLIPLARSPRNGSHSFAPLTPQASNGFLSAAGGGYGAGSVSMISQLHGGPAGSSASVYAESFMVRVLPVSGANRKGAVEEDDAGGKGFRGYDPHVAPLGAGDHPAFHIGFHGNTHIANSNSSGVVYVPSIPNNVRFAPLFEGMPSNLMSLDSVHASRMVSGGAEGEGMGVLGRRTSSRFGNRRGGGGPLSSSPTSSAQFGGDSKSSNDPTKGFSGGGDRAVATTPSLLGRCLVYQPSSGPEDDDFNGRRFAPHVLNNNSITNNATMLPHDTLTGGSGDHGFHTMPAPLPFNVNRAISVDDDFDEREEEGDKPVTLVMGLVPVGYMNS